MASTSAAALSGPFEGVRLIEVGDRVRWLVLLLVVGIVAAGCSGDDDDTASDVPTTTAVPSSTVAPSVTEAATSTAVSSLEDVPIYQLGESAPLYDWGTLTIASIEADPVPAPDPAPPDGERYVLVRGTLDYTGPIGDEPGAPDGLGWDASLNPVGNTDEEDEYRNIASECDEAIPDADATLHDDLAETMEVALCFSVPADESSWSLYLPSLALAAFDGGTLPDAIWEVSL